jgi:hypothetical protein
MITDHCQYGRAVAAICASGWMAVMRPSARRPKRVRLLSCRHGGFTRKMCVFAVLTAHLPR